MGYESPRVHTANPGDGQQRPQLPPGYVLPSLAQPDTYRILPPLPVTAPDPDAAERRAITSLALGIVSLVGAATMLSFDLSFHVCYANCLLAPIASIVGVTFGRVGLYSRRRYRIAIVGITISSVALAVAALALVYQMIVMAIDAMNS
jgi:hypothetical protein